MRLFFLPLFLMFCGFTVYSQALLLTKPSGAEAWPAYSTQRISWTSANVDLIKIEVSVDSGRNWSILTISYAASAGYFDWQIPAQPSDSCFVRISDISNPAVSSSNFPNNPFRIPKPTIVLDELPLSGFGGTALTASWNASGVRFINLYVSTNGGATFLKVSDNISAVQGLCNIVLPLIESNNCYLKITNAENELIADTTNIAFQIVRLPGFDVAKFKGGSYDGHASISNKPDVLRIIKPMLNDTLLGGSSTAIRWVATNIDQVEIQYSLTNGGLWQSISGPIAATTGLYNWIVPQIATNEGLIRIRSANDTTKFAVSEPFVIRAKQLKLPAEFKQPMFGFRTTAFPIEWTQSGLSFVRLKIIENDSVVSNSISAAQEIINWVIPVNAPDSFRIEIVDTAIGGPADTSGYVFVRNLPGVDFAKYRGGSYDGHASQSNNAPSVTVTYPNGGETFFAGATVIIRWNSSGIDTLKLMYSLDSGMVWKTVDTNFIASAGSGLWKLPNISSPHAFIKLYAVSDTLISDVSDGAFVLSSKQLTNTTDSLGWVSNLSKQLTWNASGISALRFEFKQKELDPWTLIASGYPATAEVFNWVVPDACDSLWIRLSDADATSLAVVNTFHKLAKSVNLLGTPAKYYGGSYDGHAMRSNINRLDILRPQANEILVGGTQYSITWGTVNVSDSVLLQYSLDSGKTWLFIDRVLAVNGTFNWNIPGLPAGNIGMKGVKLGSSEMYVSEKCMLRAVDYKADNEIVGKSKVFSILAETSGIVVSLKDGDWHDPSVWSNGLVPSINTSLKILHHIMLKQAGECKRVEVASPGKLEVIPGIQLSVSGL